MTRADAPSTRSSGRGSAVVSSSTAASAGLHRLGRVVVAEDDPDLSAVVVLALGRVGGLEVTACANGRAVLDLVPHLVPDLYLFDVMMPEMDGLETLRRLQLEPRTAAVPVIFMTARVRPTDLETYYRMGAAGVIAKPFDPLTLTQHLHRLYAEARHADA
jgi:two-component system, OmpR family, response regulator